MVDVGKDWSTSIELDSSSAQSWPNSTEVGRLRTNVANCGRPWFKVGRPSVRILSDSGRLGSNLALVGQVDIAVSRESAPMHPRSNWRRLPDSWLFAFCDSQMMSMPLDREAWATSCQRHVAWVVDAVRGPTIVGRACGPVRPAANEPRCLGRRRIS